MSQMIIPNVTLAKVADRIYKTAAIFVVLGTVLFLAAGRLNWTEAWVFLGIYFMISLAGAVWILYRDPDLSEERWQGGKNAKHWLMIAVLVIRTSLEDKVLQAELAGYPEYTRKVHYRLVPGIW